MRTSFWKQLHLHESYLSITLGFLVVVVSGILMYNFVTKHTLQQQISQNNPSPTQIKLAQALTPTGPAQQIDLTPTSTPATKQIALTSTTISTPKPTIQTTPTQTPKQIVQALTATPIQKQQQPIKPTNESSESYTVQKSDTLWAIAERTYGTGYAWTQIAQINSLPNPGQIQIGQQLKLPSKTMAQGPNPNILSTSTDIPASHTVTDGESLWSISIKYFGNGYMWQKIAQENSLVHPNIIHRGNVLKLPHPTATLDTTGGKSQASVTVAAVVQR